MWIVIGVVVLVFIILCIGGTWIIHHRDVQHEEKWRKKYMEERLAQIDANHKVLDRRHTIHAAHAEQLNDLKE